MNDREKVTIARVEYGPATSDVKVILSDGKELDNLTSVNPEVITVDGVCAVTVSAILKGKGQ